MFSSEYYWNILLLSLFLQSFTRHFHIAFDLSFAALLFLGSKHVLNLRHLKFIEYIHLSPQAGPLRWKEGLGQLEYGLNIVLCVDFTYLSELFSLILLLLCKVIVGDLVTFHNLVELLDHLFISEFVHLETLKSLFEKKFVGDWINLVGLDFIAPHLYYNYNR